MPEDRTTVFRMPGGLMAELKCHRGKRVGEAFSLSSGTFVIGRSSGCDLALPDEPGVSKIHAKIIAEDEKYFILDNESRNGTLVNGKPVKKQELNHGDSVQICGCGLMFYSLGATGINETGAVTDDSGNPTQTQAPGQSTKEKLESERDTSEKFYSDEKAHSSDVQDVVPISDDDIDEEADTLQPIDHDTLMGDKKSSDDSMTVTAAMVSSAQKSAEAESRSQDAYHALAEVKEKQGEQKPSTKTVTYQDMRTGTFTGSGKGAHVEKNVSETKKPKQTSSSRSFIFGLLVAMGLYTGWLYVSNMEPLQDAKVELEKMPSKQDEADSEQKRELVQDAKDVDEGPVQNDDWLNVETIYGRKYPVDATSSGVISNLTIKNGEMVFVGQSLFTLTNNRLSSDIETIKLEIKALERLAKSNDTEFVREGLREEKQKLKSLRSKQKKIVKAKYAGIVTNLKQLEGQFVKRGNVILRISRKGGPPRIGLVEANASKIQKGTVLDVKSKSGERHQVTVLRKEIVSGKAILTLDLGSKKIKIAAVRITSRP